MDFGGFGDWDWTAQAITDEEQTGEDNPLYSFNQQSGHLFLIDCNPSMFEKNADAEESSMEICLKCIRNVYQQKAISGERDLFAIVFYGSGKSVTSDGKTMYVFQNLGQLNSARILELEEKMSNLDEFRESLGHSNNYEMSDVFWACSNVFSKCNKTLGYKRIVLFTNEDDPHKADQNLQRKAVAKATDLHEVGIDLELLHMNKPNAVFDLNKFYTTILHFDDDENFQPCDASEKFQELLSRVLRVNHKRRVLGKVPWSIGDNIELSVGVYCLSRKATIPTARKIHRATNAEVKSLTRLYNKDTGDDVMPQDVVFYQMYSNKRICLEKEETEEIRKFGVQGLKLMGFKPREALKKYYHAKPSHFIYPDEQTVKGSTQIFSALLIKCLERNVIPVCWYAPRSNSTLELVYLLPQAEERDENNVQTTPPGFHVIFMPFAEDFRDIEIPDNARANGEQIDSCKAMIKKLTFPYDPHQFENPALQKFYRNLEAMALNRDEPEEITDYTLPDYDRIEKRAGEQIKEFKESVFPENYTGAPQKRASSSASGTAAKKIKSELSSVDIKEEAKAGRLTKMTVITLKEIIKEKGIKTSATKKADLMDAIKSHFGV